MTFPEMSVQGVLQILTEEDWWVPATGSEPSRGRLTWALVPHVHQTPHELLIEGREEPTEHRSFKAQIRPISPGTPRPRTQLPVASMPLYGSERHLAYRGKRRPCVFLTGVQEEIPREYRSPRAKWQTSPSVLVAPYYGVDEKADKRAGWKQEFVDRIQLGQYPQYLWDKLPLPGSSESILRLDHVQPLGVHHMSYQLADWRLGDEAMALVDAWLDWLRLGTIDPDSVLAEVLELLAP